MPRMDLFGAVPRRTPRVLMHATDAGQFPDGKACADFTCPKCGHETGWIYATPAEARAGIPCDKCNEVTA